MINRFVFMVFFCVLNFSVFAESNWLNQRIAAEENKTQLKTFATTKASGLHPRDFFSQHGLVLFFASSCPHCHQFAPVLKAYVLRHQAKLLPLSFDNQPLPEFPNFQPATTDWVNVAFKGQAINYPALFIANPKTAALYPVAFGSMSEDELEERMQVLVTKIMDYENQGVAR